MQSVPPESCEHGKCSAEDCKVVQTALRTERDLLRHVLAHAPGVVYACEPNRAERCTFISDNVSRLFGYAPQVFLGNSGAWLRLVHPGDRPAVLHGLNRVLHEGYGSAEYRFLHADGGYRCVRDSAQLVRDEHGERLHLVGYMTDITAAREAEEAVRHRERLEMFAAALIAGQEEERKRVSRELHDELNQRLAVLVQEVDALRKGCDGTHRDALAGIRSLIVGAAAEARSIALRLHPARLDQLGLRAALEFECAARSERTGIRIDFTHTGVPPVIPDEISLCLYRIVQEALNNVAKHSESSRASVTLAGTPDGINLSIQDDGRGFDVATHCDGLDLANTQSGHGLGLVSVRERVRIAGGTMKLCSARNAGTRIEVAIPLAPEARNVAGTPAAG